MKAMYRDRPTPGDCVNLVQVTAPGTWVHPLRIPPRCEADILDIDCGSPARYPHWTATLIVVNVEAAKN